MMSQEHLNLDVSLVSRMSPRRLFNLKIVVSPSNIVDQSETSERRTCGLTIHILNADGKFLNQTPLDQQKLNHCTLFVLNENPHISLV
jgi:hypothetical protein